MCDKFEDFLNLGSWYHQIEEINKIRINQKRREANIQDKGDK